MNNTKREVVFKMEVEKNGAINVVNTAGLSKEFVAPIINELIRFDSEAFDDALFTMYGISEEDIRNLEDYWEDYWAELYSEEDDLDSEEDDLDYDSDPVVY